MFYIFAIFVLYIIAFFVSLAVVQMLGVGGKRNLKSGKLSMPSIKEIELAAISALGFLIFAGLIYFFSR